MEAVAEFRKILDNPGITVWHGEYPAEMVEMARAKVLIDDMAAARKHYQGFFALWKDADPDIPILIEAQAEYEKLLEE